MIKNKLYIFLFLMASLVIFAPNKSMADCSVQAVENLRDAAVEKLTDACKKMQDFATSTYNPAAQEYISA